MKKIKYFLIVVVLGALVWAGYTFIPLICFFNYMHSQAMSGKHYMDSIEERDIPEWIERTQNYLNEYNPHASVIGEGVVPGELQALGVIRIDIHPDSVYYLWIGGMDHTYLEVCKTGKGDFSFYRALQ